MISMMTNTRIVRDDGKFGSDIDALRWDCGNSNALAIESPQEDIFWT